ncbi:hypothetical protein CXB51_014718 [Gossypium anomalum]|uniref:DUF4283 domain-containing protein n=1 Tax=Gossypium anomalum TaxID=47600 RepID=A0A8J6CXB1_9ROSI|nr:hypothetical protein CXB51_014718 [Gossypium anomalum]
MNTLALPNEGGGGDCVNDDHNIKKVRFKELGEDLDRILQVDDLGSDILDREDFEFTEGDVMRSNVNGIPTINFSKQIRHLLVKDMNTTVAFPSVVLAWIQFPGPLGFLYKRRVLEDIGSSVGKVAWLDLKIDNKIGGRFTRMVVYVDLEKSLISQVLVNDKFQRVEFEALSAVRFACSRYGHVNCLCPSEMVDSNLPSCKKNDLISSMENIDGGTAETLSGPWMIVE